MIKGSSIPEDIVPDTTAQEEQDDLFVQRMKRLIELESIGHNITIVILRMIVAILGAIGIIRMMHLILPGSYKWLTADELLKIDEFFIHGTVGALVVEFLRGKMSSLKN